MNILHLTYSLGVGGRRNAIVNLANGLSKKNIRNYACSITPIEISDLEDLSQTSIIYSYTLNSRNYNFSHVRKILKSLNSICIKNDIDLIHTHDAASQLFASLLKNKTHKIPHVYTFHRSLSTDTKGTKNKLRNFYANRNTDAIIIGSNDRKKHYITNNPYIQKEKVIKIPFGIELNKFIHSNVNRHEIRNQIKLTETDIVLGCVGHYGVEKGIDNTIRAFSHIKNHPDTDNVKLVISGKGSNKETTYIKSLTNELGIDSDVIFAGFHNDIEKWYSSFDILVHSARTEAFGLVLVEAMAASLPIIANRVGGMIDIIEHEKSGYLVEPDNPKELADSAIILLKDPKLRDKFGKHGFILAKSQYTQEIFATSYHNLYSSLFK